MKYLVDADVLSELTKPQPSTKVLEWWRRNDLETATNPVVLGELEFGILCLPSGRRRTRLKEWFDSGVMNRPVLEIDAQTARIWAVMLADQKKTGRRMPYKDSLIAATAKQHGLTIATRNVNDYRYAGVPLVNPFEH